MEIGYGYIAIDMDDIGAIPKYATTLYEDQQIIPISFADNVLPVFTRQLIAPTQVTLSNSVTVANMQTNLWGAITDAVFNNDVRSVADDNIARTFANIDYIYTRMTTEYTVGYNSDETVQDYERYEASWHPDLMVIARRVNYTSSIYGDTVHAIQYSILQYGYLYKTLTFTEKGFSNEKFITFSVLDQDIDEAAYLEEHTYIDGDTSTSPKYIEGPLLDRDYIVDDVTMFNNVYTLLMQNNSLTSFEGKLYIMGRSTRIQASAVTDITASFLSPANMFNSNMYSVALPVSVNSINELYTGYFDVTADILYTFILNSFVMQLAPVLLYSDMHDFFKYHQSNLLDSSSIDIIENDDAYVIIATINSDSAACKSVVLLFDKETLFSDTYYENCNKLHLPTYNQLYLLAEDATVEGDTCRYTINGHSICCIGTSLTSTDVVRYKLNYTDNSTYSYVFTIDNQFIDNGDSIYVDENGSILNDNKLAQLDMQTTLEYDCRVTVPSIYDNDERQLFSCDNGVVTYGNSTFDISTGKLIYLKGSSLQQIYYPVEYDTVKIVYDFLFKNACTFYCRLKGIFNYNDITINNINLIDNTITIENGTVLLLDEILSGDYDNIIEYNYTDTMDTDSYKEDSKKEIQTLDESSEFQFLRQQWNTTDEIENYFFINSLGDIMSVDKFNINYLQKTDAIDDWNGNKYTTLSVINRSEVITGGVVKYGVTNLNVTDKDMQAYFWTLTMPNNNGMSLNVYSLDKDTFLQLKYTLPLTVTQVELGNKLIENRGQTLYTYSDIQVSDFIFDAKYSSTVIDNTMIFGIHADNNFNQWAVVINMDNGGYYVIQGYGYVGIDGDLTGGEIPVKYYNVTQGGFTGTVQPLEYLKSYATNDNNLISDISEIYYLEESIVGTTEQQWYISKNIDSIVSHLVFNKSTMEYEVVPLYLNNNIDVSYSSPSFYVRTMSDEVPHIVLLKTLLEELFTADVMNNWIINAINIWTLAPYIFMITPRLSLAGYLQQAIGQYAYVHYNTRDTKPVKGNDENDTNNVAPDNIADNEITNDKPIYTSLVTSDELSFNTQVIKQTASVKEYFSTLAQVLAVALQAASVDLFASMTSMAVNARQNQSAISDIGRKYTQSALQNIDSLLSSNMTISSLTPTITSTVAGTYTLDMFYSTSDKQEVQAGPGFVTHNFIAQCVAQSATSNQFELNQVTFSYAAKELSAIPTKVLYNVMTVIHAATLSEVDVLKEAGVISRASAIVLLVADAVTEAFRAVLKFELEVVDTFVSAISGNRISTSVTAALQRHTYDIEGKHKYGSKSETFMYPCWGVGDNNYYNDEMVEAISVNKPWSLHQDKWTNFGGKVGTDYRILSESIIDHTTEDVENSVKYTWQNDEVPYYIVNCRGKSTSRRLPKDMAFIVGAETFLPTDQFRNENISTSAPVFYTNNVQDFKINDTWQLSQTVAADGVVWVSCKDTKLIDGDASNIVVSPWFAGVACPYAAIEIKQGVDIEYARPWAITPEALAFNHTGKNVIYKRRLYHGFDGVGNRIINWVGGSGLDKEFLNYHYCFQCNDRFKRSNKLPPNMYMGNFGAAPYVDITVDNMDKLYNEVMIPSKGVNLKATTIGEDRDIHRYALPIFTEFVSTLPAYVKALGPYKLATVSGITSLCTDLRNTQAAYKAPESIDFTINKSAYRMTTEYICSVTTESGVIVTEDLVPVLGLTYIGSTPFEAFLYSQATRQYYSFTGGTNLQAIDMLERFRDIQNGKYDFINQEVVMQCLATFDRLDSEVSDDANEADNIMVLLLKDRNVLGELPPPVTTIFNNDSWFKILSMSSGVVYQGPNRCIINRDVYTDYMKDGILANRGNWTKVDREQYHPFRKYKTEFENVTEQIGTEVGIRGWTHNPFLLVTSPLGTTEEEDCMFEWEITFAWPVEMDKLYGVNDYACVNIAAETMTPGGKKISRPTHVFLTKQLFTRDGNYGYYSFRYTSKSGAGNRERLHIWSDAYIAVSSLQCEYKVITSRRTSQLTQQVDVQTLNEF